MRNFRIAALIYPLGVAWIVACVGGCTSSVSKSSAHALDIRKERELLVISHVHSELNEYLINFGFIAPGDDLLSTYCDEADGVVNEGRVGNLRQDSTAGSYHAKVLFSNDDVNPTTIYVGMDIANRDVPLSGPTTWSIDPELQDVRAHNVVIPGGQATLGQVTNHRRNVGLWLRYPLEGYVETPRTKLGYEATFLRSDVPALRAFIKKYVMPSAVLAAAPFRAGPLDDNTGIEAGAAEGLIFSGRQVVGHFKLLGGRDHGTPCMEAVCDLVPTALHLVAPSIRSSPKSIINHIDEVPTPVEVLFSDGGKTHKGTPGFTVRYPSDRYRTPMTSAQR